MLRPELQRLAKHRFWMRECHGIMGELHIDVELESFRDGWREPMTDCEQCGGWGRGPDVEEGSGIPFTCYACHATGRVPVAAATYDCERGRFREFVVNARNAVLRNALERARQDPDDDMEQWEAWVEHRHHYDPPKHDAHVRAWEGDDDIPF